MGPSRPREGWTFECRGVSIRVGQGVYPPSEDSLLLVDGVMDQSQHLQAARSGAIRPPSSPRVLEVGCGAGVVATVVAARHPAARVVVVDLSRAAATCARANGRASARRGAHRVHAVQADLVTAFRPGPQFDVVAFNPPYLPSDPRDPPDLVERWQWDGGVRGIELTVAFLSVVGAVLAPRAEIFLIASSHADLPGLAAAIQGEGYTCTTVGREHIFFEDILCLKLELKLGLELDQP